MRGRCFRAPKRSTGLTRGGPLIRRTPMRRGRPLRRTALKTRAQDRGPSQTTRDLVHNRSDDRCEWPGCPRMRRDVHHRLNRKDGGRHGEMRDRLNGAGWLLDVCRHHHRFVTSPVGADRTLALDMGWLLREFDDDGEPVDALMVPVLTRHHPTPVLLNNAGGWRAVAA